MFRTQIQLTESQTRALKRMAADRGVSVTKLVRQILDLFLRAGGTVDNQEQRHRAIAAAGRFRSGRSDLATEHDRYLQDAYEK